MDMRLYPKFLEALIQDEGYERLPYKDTTGNLTIGIGHNLTANGLSDAVIMQIANEDMETAYVATRSMFTSLSAFTQSRQIALLSMMFNMGAPTLSGFHSMIDSVKRGDWDRAAEHALNSKWAHQVGERSNRIANLLRT
jgi:lysozyme